MQLDADDDAKNIQYAHYIARTVATGDGIDIGSNVNMPEDPEHFANKDQRRHTFFVLAGASAAGFDGDLTKFLGAYGDYARPAAVANGACFGSTAYGDLPCAAFEVALRLAPGERRSFACLFGVGRADREGRAAALEMDTPEKIEAALTAVRTRWRSRLDALSAETPDANLNAMVNTWAPFNSLIAFYWSRAASLSYSGERDGLGFRDTLQDFLASASLAPEETRARLELMLTGQCSNGGALPVVQPFNHRPGRMALPTRYRSDDALWFFNAVPAFVKETGDLAFFRRPLPFADRGEATVLGHLRRALEFNLERCGAHGLPCGLQADWNDCLRLGEQGESVFVALQLRFGLNEYHAICSMLGESAEAAWAAERRAELDRNLEAHAWDGEWYLRAYRSDGMKFGSRECEEGRIFMNPQAWAVFSGHATGARAEQALESMHRHLATDYGVMLCAPPYVKTDPEVCLARLFNPGCKENAGIFNHTQGWAAMAAAKLGWGDRAWEYLRNVLPASFNDRAEIREVEPYVVCQSTHSRFSPRFGAGRLSWLSGAASWNYAAMTTALLGLRADYEGLRVDPCIPRFWRGFTARRRFRGAEYRIAVHNPRGVCRGVRRLTVDGHPVEGNLLPPAKPGAVVAVRATLE